MESIDCPSCGEPWDAFHIRHDEAANWGLDDVDLERIQKSGSFSGEDDPVRKAAEIHGWKFHGNSLYAFVQCRCCKRHEPLPDAEERRKRVKNLANLAGSDHDLLLEALGFGHSPG